MTAHVLVSCMHLQRHIDRYREVFQKHDLQIEMPQVEQMLHEHELLKIIGRFQGVIAGDDEFTAKVLRHGKELRVLVKWGIGVDAIDVAAAERLGIRVLNTPNVFSEEVAGKDIKARVFFIDRLGIAAWIYMRNAVAGLRMICRESP